MTFRRLGLAVGVLTVPASLLAQPVSRVNSVPDKNATQVMVTSLKSTEKDAKDKGVGFMAAEELRDKMGGAFSARQVYVIPVERINVNLEASQFSIYEGLELHDAKQLGVMLRADEYTSGTAARTPAGFRVELDLVLTRDIAARQPLGVGTAPKLGDAVSMVVRELKEARKQLDGEKKCRSAAMDKKYAEAIAFAQAGIVAYPKATLARMCLVSVLQVSAAPPAEVAKVARELVQLDPRSNVGLKYLADYFRNAKESDSLVVALIGMLKNDPRNTQLQIEAITEIADAKNPGLARPIIDSAVTVNPGDPDLLKLRWQILGAVKDWPEMMKAGDELTKLDTAFADTTYFQRTSVALQSDSAWQKAAEVSARGVAKFPTNATLVGMEIQQLQKAGQAQQALEKLDKAIAAKVPVRNAGTQRLLLMTELKSAPPLIIAAAKELIAAGDTSQNIHLILLGQTGTMMSAAQKNNNDVAELTATLEEVKFIDSVVKPDNKSQAAFMQGTIHYLLAAKKGTLAGEQKSCPLAKEAKVHIGEAFTWLPQGAKYNAQLMQQLMGAAMQTDPAIDQTVKALCK